MMKKKLMTIACFLCVIVTAHAQTSWVTNGNAITSGNFLGTTNLQNLLFKANSTFAGVVDVNYNNTFFGLSSGGTIGASAYQNTAVGYQSYQANTTGYQNVSMGYQSMFSNLSGIQNVAVGFAALKANTTGFGNVAVGSMALQLDTASYNTAVGLQALYHNTNGSLNNAMGSGALTSNTVGSSNSSIGANSMYYNTTGSFNTATGVMALVSNTTASNNSADGYEALYSNVSGTANTSVGFKSLYSNTASFNSALGDSALYFTTSGQQNSAVGFEALVNNTTGTCNTSIGRNSLSNNTTGSNNTALGCSAGPLTTNLSNTTAIGSGATVTTSNQIVVGNTSVTQIGGYATGGWTTYPSDVRFKKNVKEDVPGLSFINQLRPVTYNIDVTGLNKYLNPGNSQTSCLGCQSIETQKAIAEKESLTCTGFIAQEVEASAKKIGYNFSGIAAPKDGQGLYGLGYADFVVPLVKSVQELSKTNDSLRSALTDLQSQIAEIRQMISNSKSGNISVTISGDASLKQNAPNPFNSNTVIGYSVPEKALNAKIVVTDVSGNTLKSISVNNKGEGQATISGGELSAGTYFYSLVVDGNKVDTKKMILTK